MKKIIVSAILSLLVLSACTTTDAYTGEQKVSSKTKGAAAGAVVGGIIGGIANGKDGALAGAAIGGVAGLGYGAYLDKQESELREELKGTGVQVVRSGDNLELILPGNITFATSSSTVKDDFKPVLNSIVKVTNKYKKSNLQIIGYTDSTGKYDYNMQLSRKRANAVKEYLVYKGVASGRIVTDGKGPSNPIASNTTATGKEQNRRVEISFVPVSGESY